MEKVKILEKENIEMQTKADYVDALVDENTKMKFFSHAMKLQFPKFFEICKNVWHNSKEHNLNPYLMMAIIHHESGFDPNAIGKTADFGLMQINLKTWQSYFNLTLDKLFDVEENIKIGCYIFRHYLNQSNNEIDALIKYNQGYSKKESIYPRYITKSPFYKGGI